jgi:ferredoxin
MAMDKKRYQVSTSIYYFSGTGNSLVVARDIAEKLEGKLIAIPLAIKEENTYPEGDTLGIVFPVYHQGLPNIINRFIEKLDNIPEKYIFGVCTYGDSPGISLEYLDENIKAKGGKLSAGFTVKMPYNYVTPSLVLKDFFRSFKLREIDSDKCQKMYHNWQKKLEYIFEIIKNRKKAKIETAARAIEKMVDYLNLRDTLQKKIWLKIANFQGSTDSSFRDSIQLMDYGFQWDAKCNGCGTCVKVCPVNNIKMEKNRPIWQHHCEQCFACLQWCPQEAIQFSKNTVYGKRYHHPDLTLSDVIYS